MTTRLKIDFVSDIACPWCAVGLGALEQALARLDGEVEAELHFQPFELNPQMPPGGQDVGEHLTQKYGSTPEQQAMLWEQLCRRAEAVGFGFRAQGRGRVWNTFDAHRLLHWAGELDGGHQRALKRALLHAYFGEGSDVSDPQVLLRVVDQAGLDVARARAILQGDDFAAQVRDREDHFLGLGIHAVPSVIVNDRHLIQGGQPPEVFEQALRQIAADAAA